MAESADRSDPSRLRRLTDQELLRLVADPGEDKPAGRSAKPAWNELIARDFDRVRGLVSAWRLPGRADVAVELQDRDDAVQHAFVRLLRMLDNFKGKVLPQYRAAMNTCVDFACRDFCRGELRHDKRYGGSFDETLPGEDGEGQGRFDSLMAKLSAAEQARREEEQQDADARQAKLDAVRRGIDALPNQNMRDVLTLTMNGRKSREIADQLRLSVANVDQLRSRGVRRLDPDLPDELG